jgi:hypothetical protein
MNQLDERIQAFGDVAGMAKDAMALLAVLEVGAFRALLAGPATAAELGEATQVSGWRLGSLLDRVSAMGFLVKDGERYALISGDEALFDPDGEHSQALDFADVDTTFSRLAQCVTVLRSDQKLELDEALRAARSTTAR